MDVKVEVSRSGWAQQTAILRDAFRFTRTTHGSATPRLLQITPRFVTANEAVNMTGLDFSDNIKDYRVAYVGAGE